MRRFNKRLKVKQKNSATYSPNPNSGVSDSKSAWPVLESNMKSDV